MPECAVRSRWGWGTLFLCLLCLGCGPDQPASSPQETNTPADSLAAEFGGTAVVALESDPDVLNSLIRRSASAGQILDLMQDSLADMGDDLSWNPRIARSWIISPDRTRITYQMQPWFWSDGVPLTAHDVVRTCELFLDSRVASPRRGQYRDIVSVTALDSFTVEYVFGHPQPDPVARSFHAILPGHLLSGLDPAEVMNWPLNRNPLSCGPFQLDDWEHGQSMSLVPNPYYTWAPPHLARLVFRVIPDPAGRVVALETGQVDMVPDLTPGDARRLADRQDIRVIPQGGRRYYYLNWNLRRPLFVDPTTRKALSLALDRQRMIDTLMLGFGEPATGPIAPVMWNFNRELEADPFDPQRARILLEQAGWKDTDGDGILERDGQPFHFTMVTKLGDPVRESGAVIIRENLKAVGVEVKIRVLELATGLELLNSGEFDSYFGSFNANLYGDPSGVIHSRATGEFNKGAYANAQVDSLLDLALSLTARDQALEPWLQMQEILLKDQPSAFLFYPEKLVGVSTRLQGVEPHLLSPLNNICDWWIATGDRKYRTEQ